MKPIEETVDELESEDNRLICPLSYANNVGPTFCTRDCPWWIYDHSTSRQDCAIVILARRGL